MRFKQFLLEQETKKSIIAYHGSFNKFEHFKLPTKESSLAFGNGVYFTRDIEYSKRFNSKYLYKCQLVLKKSYIVNKFTDDISEKFIEKHKETIEQFLNDGYDSLIVDLPGVVDEIVVYDVDCIKILDIEET